MLSSFIHTVRARACIASIDKAGWAWKGTTLMCPKCGAIIASCNFNTSPVQVHIRYKYLRFSSWILAHAPPVPPSPVDPYGLEEAIAAIHKRDPSLDAPLVSDVWEDCLLRDFALPKEKQRDPDILRREAWERKNFPPYQSFFDKCRPPTYGGRLTPVSLDELCSAQREFEQALAQS